MKPGAKKVLSGVLMLDGWNIATIYFEKNERVKILRDSQVCLLGAWASLHCKNVYNTIWLKLIIISTKI